MIVTTNKLNHYNKKSLETSFSSTSVPLPSQPPLSLSTLSSSSSSSASKSLKNGVNVLRKTDGKVICVFKKIQNSNNDTTSSPVTKTSGIEGINNTSSSSSHIKFDMKRNNNYNNNKIKCINNLEMTEYPLLDRYNPLNHSNHNNIRQNVEFNNF